MAEVMTKKPSFADIAAMGTSAATVTQSKSPTPAESAKKETVPTQQHQQIETDKKEKQPLQNKVSSEAVIDQSPATPTDDSAEKSNQVKERRPRSDSTPTPAESSQRKQQEKNKNRGNRNRGRARNAGSKNNGKEKKGSWKKLDVDINFTKDQGKSNGQGGNSGSRKKVGVANRVPSSGGNSKPKGDANKKGSRGSGARVGRHRGNKKNGDTAESNPNWREKPTGSKTRRHYQAYQQPPPEVLEQMKTEAVKQIEYFFSTEELVKNVFLRRHMDIEGYLPAAIVFNFPSVAGFGLPYNDLLSAVSHKSDKVDVDSVNECLRVHGDYQKWLFPNDDGSYGCPKWLKQAETEDSVDQTVEPQPDGANELDITEESPKSTKEDVEQLQVEMNEEKEKADVKNKGDSKLKEAGSPPDLAMTDSDTDHDSR